MPNLPRPLRVALVGATAAVTVGAGLTALSASPAQAADATTLTIQAIYPDDRSGSAGTCQIYRAIPADALGQAPSDSHTVVITLTENPESDSQDVDFCVPPAAPDGRSGVRVDHAYYDNGQLSLTSPTRQRYVAGRSITPPAASGTAGGTPASENNPDVAAGTSRTEDPTFADTNTNPSGVDYVDDVSYDGSSAGKEFIEFGVVGLVPGGAFIDAFIDKDDDGTRDTDEPQATRASVTFTAGGPPGSVAAHNAVTTITADRTQYTAVQSTSTSAVIDLKLTNNDSDTVFGVTPSFRVQNGPNASSDNRSCTESTNFGDSTCSFLGTNPGTDTLLIWVNQSAKPNSTATPGPDAGEPTETVTVTTYAQPSPAASARFVDITPDAPTSQTAGSSKLFTATVTDSGGAPVQGVQVTFEESGPGQLQGGNSADGNTSTLTVSTGPDGRVQVTNVTRAGESGSQTITARISSTATQCGQVFNGQTGRCSDTTTNTVGSGASASPSPTSTATASPTASASASPTATASPTGTASPSATAPPGPCSTTPTVTLQPTTINATGSGGVTVSGPAGRQIELLAYSQPSTTYRVVRTGTLDSNGTISFTVRPPTNTRLYAQLPGCDTDETRFSRVLNVRTTFTLEVTRNGKQDYTFSGDSLPARSGGLIVSLYRYTDTGSRVLTAQARANAENGEWVIRRVFTGTGRFDFQVRTGQDLQNAPGASNIRSLLIF